MLNIQVNQARNAFLLRFGKKSPKKAHKPNPIPKEKSNGYNNLLIVPNNLEPHIIALMEKGLS